MLNWKKAQAMVEFAVIIPLFIMLIMGIMYSGMIFADYMSFNNIARSSAHEASLSEHYDDIYALLLMDDKTFLSGSRNGEIKVWGY